MRLLFLFIAILSFTSIANGQIKQAQKQYLRDKGAFINPGFDQGYKGWTITGCTKSLESQIPTYGKALKLTCTNETFSIKQETTSYAGLGLDGLMSCKVKASAAGPKIRRIANGSPLAQLANISTVYENYEEFLTFDATSDGVEVYADANFTGDIFVEDCYISVRPDGSYKLPDQTANASKYLRTDGTVENWSNVNTSVNDVKDNFLECASFEDCQPEGVVTTSGTNTSSIANRIVEAAAYNAKKYVLESAIAGTLDYTYTKTANYSNQKLVAYCEIKTSNTGVTFSVGADGVEAGSLSVSSDNKWKYYRIPLVGGTTSQYFKIDSSDAAQTPIIDIDNCFMGKSPNETIELGTAHFVGSLTYQEPNCAWGRASPTIDGFPIDGDCSASNIIGNVSAPDTAIPAIKIPNPRTDGYYRVEWFGLTYAPSGSACWFSLSSSNTYEDQGWAYTDANDKNNNTLSGNFRFNTGGDKTIQVINNASVATSCNVYGNTTESSKFTVHFFPDDNATVVTQETELTAKTINQCSLTFNMVTNTILSKSAGCPDGISIANNGVGADSIVIPSGFYTWFPAVTCSTSNQGGAGASECILNNGAISGNLTSIPIRVNTPTGTAIDAQRVNVVLTKQETDFNTSATIVGKFENINSSDLVKVIAVSNSNQTINTTNTNIAYGNELKDNYAAFDNSTGVFIAPKDGIYKISPVTRIDTGASVPDQMVLWISHQTSTDTLIRDYLYSAENGLAASKAYNKSGEFEIEMTAGQKLKSIGYCLTNSCTSINGQVFINISEMPDYEAIVKNLSNQKTKCQTKLLTTNVDSPGVVAQLTFNGLDTSKYHSVLFKHGVYWSATAVISNQAILEYGDGTDIEQSLISGNNNSGFVYRIVGINRIFKPAQSTLQINLLDTLNSGLNQDHTYLRVCELPDTYVENTTW